MTKIMSQVGKSMTRKILATNNSILVCTGSLYFFKKNWQPILKIGFIPVLAHKAVRKLKPGNSRGQ